MSKTRMSQVKWRAMVTVALLLFAALTLLSACGGAEPTTVAVEPTTAATEPPAPTSVPTERPAPTDAPTEPPPTEAPTEPPPTDTPAPTDTPTPEVVDDSACTTCHTDEETLRALATEPEEAESLSEGEG